MLKHTLLILTTGLICLVGFIPPAAAQCPNGQAMCGGVCRDLRSDDNNCGACGATCKRAYGCNNGTCKLVCPDVQIACGDVCATPASNPMHCGGCGKACASGEYCSGGACHSVGATTTSTSSCPANQLKCGGVCRDTKVDASNCGACGVKCGTGSICVSGKCLNNCPVLQKAEPNKTVKQESLRPVTQPKTEVRRK